MDKEREYKYDNLKCLLIFLVVFAHFLELFGGEYKRIIYIVIYTFHMPMYIYISGRFNNGKPKSILKLVYIYIIWQTIYFIVDRYILNKSLVLDYSYPNWILWYIFALIVYTCIVNLLKYIPKHYYTILVIFLFVISILTGFIDKIGYQFSLSRIITFLPFFTLGYFCRDEEYNLLEFGKSLNKRSIMKAIIFFAMAIIPIGYFIAAKQQIQPKWLYGSYSYNNGGYNYIFKIMWIMLSLAEIFFLNNIISNKKIKWISSIGAYTIYIYLIHGIILKVLAAYSNKLFNNTEIVNLSISFVLSVIIIFTLGNKFVKTKLIYLTDISKITDKFKKNK